MSDTKLASTQFHTLGAAYVDADPVFAEEAFRRSLQLGRAWPSRTRPWPRC